MKATRKRDSHVNLFAKNQQSLGTLPAQTELAPDTLEQLVTCEELIAGQTEIDIAPASFDEQGYYQGQCVFKDEQDVIGAITASLSQDIEEQAIRIRCP